MSCGPLQRYGLGSIRASHQPLRNLGKIAGVTAGPRDCTPKRKVISMRLTLSCVNPVSQPYDGVPSKYTSAMDTRGNLGHVATILINPHLMHF